MPTPAASYSHICHRDLENDIAASAVPGGVGFNSALGSTGLEVLLGGGKQFFTQFKDGGKRTDGRDLIAEMLKLQGIPSAVYYPKCLHEQPVFANLGYKLGDFPESEKASREVLSLPMHPFLSESEQDLVIAVLTKLIGGSSKK